MADMQVNEETVREALAEFKDPETGRSISQLDQVHKIDLDGEHLSVTLGLTTWSAPLWEETRAELVERLRAKFPKLEVDVEVETHDRPAEKTGQIGLAAKSVIAIGSGKGGVGKSSVAVYLAYGLAHAGCKVALMDADIYGPSIPKLIGCYDQPVMQGERIRPVTVDGIKVMSMGFLVPPGEAVIWRGPMLHGALTQFLRDTDWGDLDYLLIDMPPGTGDVPLSLSQLLPLCGAVVVCTPQDVALLDATRAITMYRKVNIDVLGMVENMSFFLCPDCGGRHDIFGSGGARLRASQLDIPFLGDVPLNTQLRILGDEGKAGHSVDVEAARPYLDALSHNLVKTLAVRRRHKPPTAELPVLK